MSTRANKFVVALVVLVCSWAVLYCLPGVAEVRAQAIEHLRVDYDAEIAKLRAMANDPATRDQAMQALGELAIRAGNDLERAQALGDAGRVEDLDRLIREKLADKRPYVEKRAKDGDANALVALGMFQTRGLLTARDEEGACAAFVQAAALGQAAGSYRAALCQLKTDSEQAATLMQRAADAGHPAAQESVGRACLQRKPEPDLHCAVRYVGDSAKAGRPSAQALLGWMYANGVGVPADPRRAAALYLDAARKYDFAAQNNLGEMYENGIGVPKSARFAVGWYRQAAQAGFAAAQFNLGRLYALGVGVKKDPVTARLWLERAKAQGISQAEDVLRWLDGQAGSVPKQ
jgi:TPR repeat protein